MVEHEAGWQRRCVAKVRAEGVRQSFQPAGTQGTRRGWFHLSLTGFAAGRLPAPRAAAQRRLFCILGAARRGAARQQGASGKIRLLHRQQTPTGRKKQQRRRKDTAAPTASSPVEASHSGRGSYRHNGHLDGTAAWLKARSPAVTPQKSVLPSSQPSGKPMSAQRPLRPSKADTEAHKHPNAGSTGI